jgi:hypothetical protein
MTKYIRVQHKEERRWAIHPIWRGIGCLMGLLIMVMGYILGVEFVDYNQKAKLLDLPKVVYEPVYIKYTKYVPVLKQDDVVNKFLAKTKYGYLGFGLIFMFIGFGAFSLIYSALYRASGPGRYSPLDSPEVRRTSRRL